MKRGRDLELVRSVAKALDIMDSFSLETTELGLGEISKICGLNKTTAYRLLSTLKSYGYIEQNPVSHKYSLGFKLFNLGSVVLNRLDLRRIAIGPMKELGKKCDETIILFLFEENSRVCLERIDSNHVIRNFMEVGRRYPIHSGAPGKVYFLDKDSDQVVSWLINYYTREEVDRVLKDLEQGRRSGYMVSVEENFAGAFAVAAPIYNSSGQICASISICGPTPRLNSEKEQYFGRLVVKASREISKYMGCFF